MSALYPAEKNTKAALGRPFSFCFTPHVLSLSLAVQRKCRAAGDLVIEGTESDVHSTEESDDFVKQFHDDFLDKECVLVNSFCDTHHKKQVYASFFNRSTEMRHQSQKIKIPF